ncbi:laccase [Flagelloscypha sp. PMI_526]|nr:laccase [Flagelloscypha sp. PMI_526]
MIRTLSLFPLFLTVAYGTVNPVLNTVTDLYIVNKDVSPDGFNRAATLAGSSASSASIVGPLITGLKGGTYNIKVHNQLTDPNQILGTSIHWHGLLQRGSGWADGPAFVNQCPIAPGETFAYQFNSPNEAGTYWYHSHLGLQYCDGLRGVFVIYDKNDPQKNLYDVDDDTTIITTSMVLPSLTAMLINGKGRYNGGPAVDLSVVSVTRNKRYRMRLVSISCDVNFMFQIMGHDLNIIEADGIATQPHTPAVSNGLDSFDGGLSSGILRYVGAPVAEPPATQTEDPSVNQLKEVDLPPIDEPSRTLGSPTQEWLNHSPADPGPSFYFNGIKWQSPGLPASTAQQLLPADSIIELPKNKVIEVSIPGGLAISSPHPIHLHGHTFSVVRSAGSTNYNYVNPVRRDVVSTGDVGDNTTIRFTTDNAGAWFLHCHIDPHLDLGLAVVFAESIADVQSSAGPPTAWQDLCPAWARYSGA